MSVTNAWKHRCALTINHLSLSGDQSNFPVALIWDGVSGNLPVEVYNAGAASPQSTGADIRFTSDVSGTAELPFEIVYFSPNAATYNARLKIYVKLTSVSSATDTVFYMWYGNPSASAYAATDTYGRNNVWTNSFVGVFHLNENSGTTATNSVGSNNGTYTGTSFPSQYDSSYGYIQSFVNANGNYVSLGTGSPWNITGNITISAIVNVSSWTAAYQAIIAKGDGTYRLARQSSNNNPSFDRNTSTVASNSTNINLGFHHVAGTFNTSVGSYCYVDGSAGTLQSNTTATASDTDDLCIGRNVDVTSRDWNGTIGEVRICSVARSSTWIAAEYNTEMNYISFVIPGMPLNNNVDTWDSFNTVMNSGGSPQGTITSFRGVSADLLFYTSNNTQGVDIPGTLYTYYHSGTHPESFNNLNQWWSSGAAVNYPYAGKSTVRRGSGTGETNTPSPTGVLDLQMHPESDTGVNENYTCTAFKVPVNGVYIVSNLAVRRVSSSGLTSAFMLYSPAKSLLQTLTATNDRAWVTDGSNTYNLGYLASGSYIYFAVRNVEAYEYDATETMFTITLVGQSSSFILIQEGPF